MHPLAYARGSISLAKSTRGLPSRLLCQLRLTRSFCASYWAISLAMTTLPRPGQGIKRNDQISPRRRRGSNAAASRSKKFAGVIRCIIESHGTIMSGALSPDLVARFRDRRVLLWVCQRYDLAEGQQPHSLDVPASVAELYYRASPDQADLDLATLYWEAIWLEGARSPVLQGLRKAASRQAPNLRRQIVTLAGASDASAQVSSHEFLPVSVLPGLLDPNAAPDARYGTVSGRRRSRIAWELASRLRQYASRTLVALGARSVADLALLYEVLEDTLIPELQLLLIWPADRPAPPAPVNPGVQTSVWFGTEVDFVSEALEAGAPVAGDVAQWALRAGKQLVNIPLREIHRVTERIAVITERDLLRTAALSMEDLENFLRGELGSWATFAAGLPVPRDYKTENGKSLFEELTDLLRRLENREDASLTAVLRLPCEPGAGATTLIRSAGFEAARAGYPTLILRPDQIDINLEDILAFATTVSETALAAGMPDSPPLLVVLDVEHSHIRTVSQILQTLAAHGRRGVVLQAFSDEDG